MSDKPIKLPFMPGYDEELGLKKIVVECSCNNCAHAEKRVEQVRDYLRARGYTERTDAHGQSVPGENTIARDMQWGDMVKRFDEVVLCHKADAERGPGTPLVMRAFCCTLWERDQDFGRIVVPMASTPKGSLR